MRWISPFPHWAVVVLCLYACACGPADPQGARDDATQSGHPDATAVPVDAAEQPDAGQPDAEQPDAAAPDAGQPDAEQPDAAAPDAGQPDAAEHSDAAALDAGQLDAGWIPVNSGTGIDGPLTVTAVNALVNAYASVLDTQVIDGSSQLTVDDAAGFSTGDEILVIQMQQYPHAGLFEFHTIVAINGQGSPWLHRWPTPTPRAAGSVRRAAAGRHRS